MPISTAEFLQRLSARDVFRISIRGQAALEAIIDDAIEAAFTPESRTTARSFGGFERRLDLAIALGILKQEHRQAIMASARLRNDLAHDVLHDVPEDRARELFDQAFALVEGEGELWDSLRDDAGNDPASLVRAALIALYTLVTLDVRIANSRREQINDALEAQALRQFLRQRSEELRGRLPETGEEN